MTLDLDTTKISDDLDQTGYSVTAEAIDRKTADALAELFDQPQWFRSTIDMQKHSYGRDQYKYFTDPVHPTVAALRNALYLALLPIANCWQNQLGIDTTYPETEEEFLDLCHAAGQHRPTPLVLDYQTGGHNRLHQDRYGDLAFPLQGAVMLSPTTAYTGGQFVLVEQRPRQQSRPHVIELGQGDLIVFPNEHRPTKGKRGHYRVTVRHGVADITSGHRRTLGLILHDAT